jgi:hypothetical protein
MDRPIRCDGCGCKCIRVVEGRQDVREFKGKVEGDELGSDLLGSCSGGGGIGDVVENMIPPTSLVKTGVSSVPKDKVKKGVRFDANVDTKEGKEGDDDVVVGTTKQQIGTIPTDTVNVEQGGTNEKKVMTGKGLIRSTSDTLQVIDRHHTELESIRSEHMLKRDEVLLNTLLKRDEQMFSSLTTMHERTCRVLKKTIKESLKERWRELAVVVGIQGLMMVVLVGLLMNGMKGMVRG